eukprot:285932-Chlamydomonas_euryale.AAC.1
MGGRGEGGKGSALMFREHLGHAIPPTGTEICKDCATPACTTQVPHGEGMPPPLPARSMSHIAQRKWHMVRACPLPPRTHTHSMSHIAHTSLPTNQHQSTNTSQPTPTNTSTATSRTPAPHDPPHRAHASHTLHT